MEHSQPKWGRPRDDIYGPYDASYLGDVTTHTNTHGHGDPKQHTQRPDITGSSVIGIKFRDGVILAADRLGSYGSLRRFDAERLVQVGEETVLGASGDLGDFEEICDHLEELVIEEAYDSPAQGFRAANVHSYLQRLMYQRRGKMDPYWNSLLVAGLKDSKPYLAFIDLLGTTYTAPALATGLGSYLAVPTLRTLCDREGDEEKVTEEQARKAIDDSMRTLFYRDGRATDKYMVATVKNGPDGKPVVSIENDVRVKNQNWAELVKED